MLILKIIKIYYLEVMLINLFNLIVKLNYILWINGVIILLKIKIILKLIFIKIFMYILYNIWSKLYYKNM